MSNNFLQPQVEEADLQPQKEEAQDDEEAQRAQLLQASSSMVSSGAWMLRGAACHLPPILSCKCNSDTGRTTSGIDAGSDTKQLEPAVLRCKFSLRHW